MRRLPSAVALELLHNAFLVHDDIEDESELRRGHADAALEHGVPLAVNAGDALACSLEPAARQRRRPRPSARAPGA